MLHSLSTRTRLKTLLNPKPHHRISLSFLAVVKTPTLPSDPPPTRPDPFHFLHNHKPTRGTTTTLHAQLLRLDLNSDAAIANSLLNYSIQSDSIEHALHVFDEIPSPNVVTWNLMLSGFNRNAMYNDTWGLFCRMHCSGFEADEFTYGSVLSACAAFGAIDSGKQVYAMVTKNGSYANGYVRSGMVDLFAKNDRFKDALRVFRDVVKCGNVVIWNGVISGAVNNGEDWVALELFREMCCFGGVLLRPSSFTLCIVLTACAALGEIEFGRSVQGWVVKCGAEDVFVGTAVVDLYIKCGKMDEAVEEFFRMPTRNVVSWTAIISGFVSKEDCNSAVEFFREMRRSGEEINKFTVTSVLAACAKLSMKKEAIQIHSLVLKSGLYSSLVVRSALINAYSKIGAIDLSTMVFRETGTVKDPGTWAAMISSYAQNQNPEGAFGIFRRMLHENVRPDKFSTSSVLSIIDLLDVGKQVHGYALKVRLVNENSVGSTLSTMYSKSDSLEESYKAFQQIHDKDSVSWASMITRFSEHGFVNQALELFQEMANKEIKPDQIVLAAILNACSASRSLLIGKAIHGHALRAGVARDKVIGGAIVNMYSKCSALELARRAFDLLPQKDEVSCSSLVSGYAQNGCIEEALSLFNYMLRDELTIDSFIISSIFWVTALVNNPSCGTQMHAHITKTGLDSDVSVGSSLLRMYSKCGSIEDCCKSFDQIENPDLICWTALITSYGQHGKGADALRGYELFRENGIKPDSVTFVAVLSACSHNGLVEQAFSYLNSMTRDYGIEPGNHHYACMVDVLGRSGRLKEAEKFIIDMPTEPNGIIWGTLLAACVIHRNVELGKLASKRIMELEPCDAGTYVSLSNMCADLGLWEEVEQVRSLMRGKSMKKEPGWSFM